MPPYAPRGGPLHNVGLIYPPPATVVMSQVNSMWAPLVTKPAFIPPLCTVGSTRMDVPETQVPNGFGVPTGESSETGVESEAMFCAREVKRLMERILTMDDAVKSLKTAHRIQIEQLKTEKREIEENYEKLKTSSAEDSEKNTNDKKFYMDECEKRNEEIKKLRAELRAKTAAYENILDEFAILQEQNAHLVKNGQMKKPCECDGEVEILKQRAIAAEVTLLAQKREVEIGILERARRDAEYIVGHLANIIEKADKQDILRLLLYQQKWLRNVQQLTDLILTIGKAFDEQIRQVDNGSPLNSLKPIVVSAPPPRPDPPTKPRLNYELMEARWKADNDDKGRQSHSPMDGPPVPLREFNRPIPAAPYCMGPAPAFPHEQGASWKAVRPPPPGFTTSASIHQVLRCPVEPVSDGSIPKTIRADVESNPTAANASSSITAPISVATGVQPPTRSITPGMNSVSSTSPKGTADGSENKSGRVDVLLDTVMSKLAHITRDEALKGLEGFRATRPNGSLKGVRWVDIVNGVCEYLEKTIPFPETTVTNSVGVPSSSLTRTAVTHNQFHMGGSLQCFQDDQCFVCLDKLTQAEILVMDCKHVAHKECLHQWFSQNKSCPVCRSYTLPTDEYPRLN